MLDGGQIAAGNNAGNLKRHIRAILQADDGLSVESEGTVYVRSLEGANYAAGIPADEGAIQEESLFDDDIDGAIDFFIYEREKRNHGGHS